MQYTSFVELKEESAGYFGQKMLILDVEGHEINHSVYNAYDVHFKPN